MDDKDKEFNYAYHSFDHRFCRDIELGNFSNNNTKQEAKIALLSSLPLIIIKLILEYFQVNLNLQIPRLLQSKNQVFFQASGLKYLCALRVDQLDNPTISLLDLEKDKGILDEWIEQPITIKGSVKELLFEFPLIAIIDEKRGSIFYFDAKEQRLENFYNIQRAEKVKLIVEQSNFDDEGDRSYWTIAQRPLRQSKRAYDMLFASKLVSWFIVSNAVFCILLLYTPIHTANYYDIVMEHLGTSDKVKQSDWTMAAYQLIMYFITSQLSTYLVLIRGLFNRLLFPNKETLVLRIVTNTEGIVTEFNDVINEPLIDAQVKDEEGLEVTAGLFPRTTKLTLISNMKRRRKIPCHVLGVIFNRLWQTCARILCRKGKVTEANERQIIKASIKGKQPGTKNVLQCCVRKGETSVTVQVNVKKGISDERMARIESAMLANSE